MAAESRARVPPRDLDAEASVLSACLLSQAALDEVRQVLGRSDFYSEPNQRVWDAVLELDRQSIRADAVTVAAHLRERKQLDQVGGNAYLAQLVDATPAVAHVAEHAAIVRAKSLQRSVIEVCVRFATEGYGELADVEKWAQDAAHALEQVSMVRTRRAPVLMLSELLPAVVKEVSRRGRAGLGVGVDTGWTDLTAKLGGWRRGKLYIVAGRPGMGKSAFLVNAALNVGKQGIGAMVFTAEMTTGELGERTIASESGVDGQKLASGKLTHEWQSITSILKPASALPVAMVEQAAATIGDIRGAIRQSQRIMRQRGTPELGLVVVDYLQLLNGERKDGESRENEVARLSQRLAWLAAEFNVTVLCASQLNRQVEMRPNKRGQLSDLRESGAIEQDAYAVLFLYRDEYYRGKESKHLGELEINVAKHRNGPTGKVWLHFDGATSRISNLASEYGASREDAAE